MESPYLNKLPATGSFFDVLFEEMFSLVFKLPFVSPLVLNLEKLFEVSLLFPWKILSEITAAWNITAENK